LIKDSLDEIDEEHRIFKDVKNDEKDANKEVGDRHKE
jgi:hypothetical protein